MSEFEDSWIDAQLRQVAVPADLLTRLRQIGTLTDEDLDAQLRDVPLPATVLDRLASIGTLNDADLDDELRHLPTPASVLESRQWIERASSQRLRQPMMRLALAACLFVAIAASYFGGVIGSLMVALGPAIEAPPSAEAVNPLEMLADTPLPLQAEALLESPLPPAFQLELPEIPDVLAAERPHEMTPGQVAEIMAMFAATDRTADPMADVRWLQAMEAFGSGGQVKLPELSGPVSRLPNRGVDPPRDVNGYDLTFQLKHGVHPFVSPAADPALRVSHVPLLTETTSYDYTRSLLADAELPPPYRIRTEDFLAAMDYGFALPADGTLGIRTAAGASPWNLPGAQLLQVGVQAGRLPAAPRPATHLTVAIDASATMQWEGRWNLVRRGLVRLIEQLEEGDRLSLVLFNDEATLLSERLPRGRGHELLAQLDTVRPRGLANLGAGLHLAALVSRPTPSDPSHVQSKLVLITDGMLRLTPAAQAELDEILAAATADQITLDVIDVREEIVDDPQLARLAQAGRGVLRHAVQTRQIGWCLIESLTGQPQLIAADVRLKITFNPGTVAMYRLIGHESSTLVGLAPVTIERDLRAQEAATALYEVVLRPGGGDDVATVEVSWNDPVSGKRRQLRQRVSRLQFAPTFREAPMALQLAALAAETAEILRGSYFAPPNTHSLADVAAVARQVHPRLAQRASFHELLDLVHRASQAKASSADGFRGASR
jgi:Ca-activated chloride channel family protein